MPVSEYVPFKSRSNCTIRPSADEAFGDLARLVGEGETLTASGAPQPRQPVEPAEVPRRPAPTPVAPVAHNVPVAELPENQLPSWARATPENSTPFDFDLQGRLEEAFGTPVHKEAQPTVFDTIVEQELANELNVAPEPVYEQPAPQPVFERAPEPVAPVAAPKSADDFDAELAAELDRALSDEMFETPRGPTANFAPEMPAYQPEPAAASVAAAEPADPFSEELARLLNAQPEEPATPQPAAYAAPSAPSPQAMPAPAAYPSEVHAEPDLYAAAPYAPEQNDFDPSVIAPFTGERDGRNRKRTVGLAIIGIALLGGTAAFALNFFQSDSGPAPVILADNAPVKERPAETGGIVVPNQDQAVYREVEGNTPEPSNQARLEGTTEEPIKVSSAQPTSQSDTLLRPRSVRTVTVRPDGTIVSQNGEVSAPAPRLGEPTLALGNTQATNPSTTSTVETSAATTPVTALPTAPVVETPEPVEVARVEPVPGPVVEAAPTPEPAPEPVAAVASAASAPFAVQISSQRSEAAAQSSYETLSNRYASALSGRGVDIRRADIEGKGTYYRVRIPAQTRQEANALCDQLKAAGGSCFVTR